MKLLIVAMALVISGTANAQNHQAAPVASTPVAAIGPPVTCIASGYWSGASITIVLKRLDVANKMADVDVRDLGGVLIRGDEVYKGTRFKNLWTFKEGILEYNRFDKARIRATVGTNSLRGSYYTGSSLDRDDVIWACDGPTDRVTMR